jgi:hypothetical protein
MIFPFPISRTGRGNYFFSSRISRRKLCSRRFGLENSENRELLHVGYFSLSITHTKGQRFSFSLSQSQQFIITFSPWEVQSFFFFSLSLSLFLSFSISLSFSLSLSFWILSRISLLNGNSRREREFYLVPEIRDENGSFF